ncbi:efflux transporter periplasmic adaptor subunit [Hydrogenovibrio sp. SC-1]|uniref:efflux RND transporter periplasmic adaptor subunit n=1 Tax=Hydrogenovibrio sp. SC-1 TaxID=2065820 RepID=UPI000C7B943B|nr:HlyD family efflux transporter periplasmic adaptor subunit [Hydrogenovibrio sp. SC-1]PLA74496.1 efflux transporter periplasmic adaptor subunit [Hydrogenovibrio sp. SC-1]
MYQLIRNHPGLAVFILLGLGLLVWGFWPQPILVETTHAKQAPLTVSIEAEGQTRVIDRYVISAPVNGMTCRLHLKVGDEVMQGQVLMGITPLASQVLDARSRAQAKAQVAAAKSAVLAAQEQASAAEAAKQLAQDKLKRYQPLLKKNLVSEEAFQQAKTEALTTAAAKRSADFNVEVARYELEAALTTLEYSAATDQQSPTERVKVTSPIDGKVLKVSRQCEGPVQTGEALLEVGDPSALEIEIDVLSADAVKIRPGMTVYIHRWGGDKTLSAIVKRIEPIGFTKVSALGVEEQRVLIICDFTSPEETWQRLGDGYRVEAELVLWHQESVLQVPSSAIFRHQDGWAVFTVEDGLAKRKPVTVGKRTGLATQIVSGLAENDVVINYPSDLIEDGTAVTSRN